MSLVSASSTRRFDVGDARGHQARARAAAVALRRRADPERRARGCRRAARATTPHSSGTGSSPVRPSNTSSVSVKSCGSAAGSCARSTPPPVRDARQPRAWRHALSRASRTSTTPGARVRRSASRALGGRARSSRSAAVVMTSESVRTRRSAWLMVGWSSGRSPCVRRNSESAEAEIEAEQRAAHVPRFAVAGGFERQHPARALPLDGRDQVAPEIVATRHVAGEKRPAFRIAERQRVDDRREHVGEDRGVETAHSLSDGCGALQIGSTADPLEIHECLTDDGFDIRWRIDRRQLAWFDRHQRRRQVVQRFLDRSDSGDVRRGLEISADAGQASRPHRGCCLPGWRARRSGAPARVLLGRPDRRCPPTHDHRRAGGRRCQARERLEQHALGLEPFLASVVAQRRQERRGDPVARPRARSDRDRTTAPRCLSAATRRATGRGHGRARLSRPARLAPETAPSSRRDRYRRSI